MKKIQLIFAVVAFVTASAGVLASQSLTPIYYEDSPSVAGQCDFEIDLPEICEISGGTPCESSGNPVYKRVSVSDCNQVLRQ